MLQSAFLTTHGRGVVDIITTPENTIKSAFVHKDGRSGKNLFHSNNYYL